MECCRILALSRLLKFMVWKEKKWALKALEQCQDEMLKPLYIKICPSNHCILIGRIGLPFWKSSFQAPNHAKWSSQVRRHSRINGSGITTKCRLITMRKFEPILLTVIWSLFPRFRCKSVIRTERAQLWSLHIFIFIYLFFACNPVYKQWIFHIRYSTSWALKKMRSCCKSMVIETYWIEKCQRW